jgi:hypothetical protein
MQGPSVETLSTILESMWPRLVNKGSQIQNPYVIISSPRLLGWGVEGAREGSVETPSFWERLIPLWNDLKEKNQITLRVCAVCLWWSQSLVLTEEILVWDIKEGFLNCYNSPTCATREILHMSCWMGSW